MGRSCTLICGQRGEEVEEREEREEEERESGRFWDGSGSLSWEVQIEDRSESLS